MKALIFALGIKVIQINIKSHEHWEQTTKRFYQTVCIYQTVHCRALPVLPLEKSATSRD